MVTDQRVVEVHPWPKIETSFVENDTIRGNITASEMGTYTSVMRPDGSLYGQGQGIITTKDGEVVTWTGQRIGHFMQDGKLRFHGPLFFSTNSNGLNRDHTATSEGINSESEVMKFTSECIKELGLPADHILTKAESMMACKDALKHLLNEEGGGAQAYLDVYKLE